MGDFVGAHGTPTKMTDAEVNQMLHQEEEKTTAETPKVRIDVERGDRVKIKEGTFESFEGTVDTELMEASGRVNVFLIEIFGLARLPSSWNTGRSSRCNFPRSVR